MGEKEVYPVNLEQFENAKNNIVDITETRGLRLLSMVQPTSPIKGNIGIAAIELDSGTNGAASGGLTEPKETMKDRAVLADIEALELAREDDLAEGLGANRGEKIDVVLRVESANVQRGGGERAVDLHPTVETVVDDEIVGHADSVGFHRVALAVVVVADRGFVEVAHSPFLRVGT